VAPTAVPTGAPTVVALCTTAAEHETALTLPVAQAEAAYIRSSPDSTKRTSGTATSSLPASQASRSPSTPGHHDDGGKTTNTPRHRTTSPTGTTQPRWGTPPDRDQSISGVNAGASLEATRGESRTLTGHPGLHIRNMRPREHLITRRHRHASAWRANRIFRHAQVNGLNPIHRADRV
jgi:hypothetical protein